MRTETPPQIRLKDYRPPNYLIDTVHLGIALDPARTRVVAVLVRGGRHSDRHCRDIADARP